MIRRLLLVALVTCSTGVLASTQARPSIILATTTSTQDSGLLDVLVPRFEQESGIEVKVIAVGTGAALRMGRAATRVDLFRTLGAGIRRCATSSEFSNHVPRSAARSLGHSVSHGNTRFKSI